MTVTLKMYVRLSCDLNTTIGTWLNGKASDVNACISDVVRSTRAVPITTQDVDQRVVTDLISYSPRSGSNRVKERGRLISVQTSGERYRRRKICAVAQSVEQWGCNPWSGVRIASAQF